MRRLVSIVLSFFLLSILPGVCQDAQKKEIAQLKKEIAELDRQIKANESQSTDAITRLELTQKKVNNYKKLVRRCEDELASLNSKIRLKKQEIKETQAALDDNLTYYESLIRSAYLSRDPKLRFLYILSGKSLTQIVRRFNYLRTASDNLRLEAKSISEKREKLTLEKSQLDSLVNINTSLLAQRNQELAKLKESEKKEQQIISKLKKDRSKYQAEVKKKQKRIDALNKKIAQMIAEAQKKSNKGKSSPQRQVDLKLSADFAANKGKLPWPVNGTIVGKYGKHKHPVYKNVDLPFNNGVNISTAKEEKVKVVFNGVVCQVVIMPGYNQCVLVQHGEYYTFYCKLKQVKVKAGEKLQCGDEIGVVDTIDGETQLHFQLWKGTTSQNPEPWLL